MATVYVWGLGGTRASHATWGSAWVPQQCPKSICCIVWAAKTERRRSSKSRSRVSLAHSKQKQIPLPQDEENDANCLNNSHGCWYVSCMLRRGFLAIATADLATAATAPLILLPPCSPCYCYCYAAVDGVAYTLGLKNELRGTGAPVWNVCSSARLATHLTPAAVAAAVAAAPAAGVWSFIKASRKPPGAAPPPPKPQAPVRRKPDVAKPPSKR